jgi:hypothetical protein
LGPPLIIKNIYILISGNVAAEMGALRLAPLYAVTVSETKITK